MIAPIARTADQRPRPLCGHGRSVFQCRDCHPCIDCGRPQTFAELHDSGLCAACLPSWLRCPNCGGRHHVAECLHGLCDKCYRLFYVTCQTCREPTKISDSQSIEGTHYCGPCRAAVFVRCECYTWTREPKKHPQTGKMVCPECYDAREIEPAEPLPTGGPIDAVRVGLTYGVEIETCRSVPEAIRGPFGYSRDGSIEGGWEYRSPILYGDAGLDVVREFCDRAAASVAEIDQWCGLHIHVDISRLSVRERKAVALAYRGTQNVWRNLVPKRRAASEYAKRVAYSRQDVAAIPDDGPRASDAWDDFCGRQKEPRAWCNFYAFLKHGTLEIRLHPGTLSGRKIVNWIKAHLRFIAYAAADYDRADAMSAYSALEAAWDEPALSDFYRLRADWHGRTIP